MEVFADFDGFWWVRTSRELAGPYDSEDEARADFECNGHVDDDAALMSGVGIGEAIFCDGSCNH